MGKLLDSFMEYLHNTPEDQLKEDWKPSGEWDGIGPTLSEFLELSNGYPDMKYRPQDIKHQTNINYEKSELSFGFFFNIFATYN